MPQVNEVFTKENKFCYVMHTTCTLVIGSKNIALYADAFGFSFINTPEFMYFDNGIMYIPVNKSDFMRVK